MAPIGQFQVYKSVLQVGSYKATVTAAGTLAFQGQTCKTDLYIWSWSIRPKHLVYLYNKGKSEQHLKLHVDGKVYLETRWTQCNEMLQQSITICTPVQLLVAPVVCMQCKPLQKRNGKNRAIYSNPSLPMSSSCGKTKRGWFCYNAMMMWGGFW
jgi:hypothetical protein